MCGIAGIFDRGLRWPADRLRSVAARMAQRLVHRGPDDAGLWVSTDGRCALAHRRLSVLDVTAAGHQPMVGHEYPDALTYNGELYNYPALQTRLAENTRVHFTTRCDTEVWLKGLRTMGAEFLTWADGMFALAYYDERRQDLLLARDPFGEKPLYYHEYDGLLFFASELSAFLEIPGFQGRISRDTVSLYLAFQRAPAPYTIYESCFKLPPGCYMRAGHNGVRPIVRYYEFLTADCKEDDARSIEDSADQLEEILLRALRGRLQADVPLGAFLSGGLDSSTVVALVAKRLNRDIKTFSIGFEGVPESEHEHARDLSRHLGTEHFDALISPQTLPAMACLAEQMDEPNADSSCVPTHAVAALARQQVTVALTGDGGDEMFGGYSRYFAAAEAAAGREMEIADRRWHVGRDYYSQRLLVFVERHIEALFGSVPDTLADLLLSCRRRIDLAPGPLLNRYREADVRNYLPIVLDKVDRMSMLSSLECRTPFLSVDLANFAAGLGQGTLLENGRGKRVLRALASRYIPQDWLDRPKRGFGVEPDNRQARAQVLAQMDHWLGAEEACVRRLIEPDRLKALQRGALREGGFYHPWSLLILERWLRVQPSWIAA